MAPRGPRSDLCVVVVTMSECWKGPSSTLAATRPLENGYIAQWRCTANVGNIRHEVGVDLISDLIVQRYNFIPKKKKPPCTRLPHPRVVILPRVCTRASDDNLGSVQSGAMLKGIVVDITGRLVETVRHRLEIGGNRRDLFAACLVAM
ncbi:hypothetical protein BC938DRAFT_480748 [Jimgerdemannia flammicorona]|uniref:Uncharacterized protein n=1 Tax=Jimgerdemannia flammicorona TaxID=994334 RepID=A0A433QIH8_9FUNG|nr:hypothetical protein BC938DRAFT_480748 [Jimgerdemannia flammicorona]